MTIPVLVLDMTTLRFRRTGPSGPVRVTTRTGQLLGTVHPRRNEKQHDAAFRALDAALATGRYQDIDPADPRARIHRHIALYNPFSGDIAFRGVPNTVTFNAGAPLPVDPDGTAGTIADEDGQLTLRLDDGTAVEVLTRDTTATRHLITTLATA